MKYINIYYIYHAIIKILYVCFFYKLWYDFTIYFCQGQLFKYFTYICISMLYLIYITHPTHMCTVYVYVGGQGCMELFSNPPHTLFLTAAPHITQNYGEGGGRLLNPKSTGRETQSICFFYLVSSFCISFEK